MDYIVFDLEWNQCPYGKEQENSRLPFEIIEIGAIKLNEKKEIVGTYHTYIKPTVYRRIHFRTQEVIGLTIEDLDKGLLFKEAAEQFFAFCGDDYRFCTWGTLDLTEFQRNLRFYHMNHRIEAPLFYEDVQKLFALTYETKKDRRSLSYAAEFLKISSEGHFHHALDDAMYTALIMQTLDDKMIQDNFSVDTFRVPRSHKEEYAIRYADYEKFISCGFANREEMLADRIVSSVVCLECGRPLRRKIQWFATGGKVYQAIGLCHTHGYVKSKIHVKRSDDNAVYAVKTTKMVSEERYRQLLDKKQKKHKKKQEK